MMNAEGWGSHCGNGHSQHSAPMGRTPGLKTQDLWGSPKIQAPRAVLESCLHCRPLLYLAVCPPHRTLVPLAPRVCIHIAGSRQEEAP